MKSQNPVNWIHFGVYWMLVDGLRIFGWLTGIIIGSPEVSHLSPAQSASIQCPLEGEQVIPVPIERR